MSLLTRVRFIALALMFASLAACTTPAPTPTPTTSTLTPSSISSPAVSPTAPPPSPTDQTQPTPSPSETPEAPDLSGLPGVEGPVPLRNDIHIRKIATVPGSFIRLAVEPGTGDLYYMDRQARIFRLTIRPEGESRGKQVYALADIGGAVTTEGMAFGLDGTLYIMSNLLQKDTNRAIIRQGILNESGNRRWSTFLTTGPLPKSNTNFDHLFNGLIVSPDGKYLYFNSGSRTDHGEIETDGGIFADTREVPLTSAIFRIPLGLPEVKLENDEEALKAQGYLFADGVRNAYDLAFSADGELWGIDNGPDADYPEELNWLREGRHYGFPWRFGNYDNPQRFPDYNPDNDHRLQPDSAAVQHGTYQNDPTFPPPPMDFTDPVESFGPDADQYRGDDGSAKDSSDEGQSIYTFTPHRSPLGLVFDTESALSDEFKGDGFILSWGALVGDLTDRGEDLLHLELTKTGDAYQAKVTQLVRDFDHPVDTVLIKDKLYVLDYGSEGTGSIWEVTLP